MHRIKWFFLSLLLLFITGCSLTSPVKVKETEKYVLIGGSSSVSHASSSVADTLLISAPIANPGYQSKNMIYVSVPYKLRSFTSSAWVAPPAQMLAPIFLKSVRKTHFFHAVITAPFSGYAKYRLDTIIETFQQEFLQPTSSQHITVLATLVDTDTNKVIASRRFDQVEAAPANNPYSGVLAANKAAIQLSDDLATFIVRALKV